ncbi:MAG: hypothetical protein HQK87_04820, partial [Nitrospinae bacterium]|nr:hypothetical protein [Nitrospinota bacterium]
MDPYVGLYTFFYEHVPAFKFSRVPHKIMVVAVTALAALTGYFAAWLRERMSVGMARTMLALFVAALVFDTHPRQAAGICRTDPNNPVYVTVSMEAFPGEKVVEIPLWPGDSAWTSLYQYYALQSRVPMLNGYLPTVDPNYIEKVFGVLFSVNAGEVTQAQRTFLREQKVGHLIFHEEAYPPEVMAFPAPLARRRLLQSPALTYRGRADRIFLFTVNDEPGRNDLPVERLAVSPVGLFFESEALPNIEGKRAADPSAGNGAALRGERGVNGTLNAGPYKNFPPGSYVARFRARREGEAPAGTPLLTVDVAADQGRKIVASTTVTAEQLREEYADIVLPFTLEPGTPWKVEFRAVATGAAETWIDSVYVTFASLPDPLTAFEAEELTSIGEILADPDARSGMAIALRPGRDPAGVMLAGPTRRYEAGRHELGFRYKAERAGAVVTLSSLLTGAPVARLELPPTGE